MAQPARNGTSTRRKQRRLFRPHEASQVRDDKEACEKALQSPHVQDKQAARDALKRLAKMEQEHAVPELTPQQRDQAKKRIQDLETSMKVGMLSHEEMRRNPPGAVDQNVWWMKQNKRRVLEWQNLQLALNRGVPADQSVEMLSIERLRPRTNHLNMDGAQIPAKTSFSFPSDAYKEGYDGIDWGKKQAKTAKEEAERPEYLNEPEPEEPAPLIEG